MSASDYPKDENLRLVLSVGHEEWLQAKLSETRRYLMLCICVAVLGTVWLAGVTSYSVSFIETVPECAVVPEGRTLEGLIREGVFPAGIKACDAAGLTSHTAPIVPERPTPTLVLLGLISLLAVIAVPTSLIEVVRGIRRRDELETFRKEHKAFLEKYDRG